MSDTLTALPEISASVQVREVDSPFPVSIYVPGAGAGRVAHLSTSGRLEEIGGMNMRQLAWLGTQPDHVLNEPVEVECGKPLWQESKHGYQRTGNYCTERFTTTRLWAPLTSCDNCRNHWEERERMDHCRAYWQKICRPSYRDTDTKHAGFAKSQHIALKEWTGKTSLFFFGPTRTGKSRLALMLAKRALIKGCSVGILYPDVLDRLNTQSYNAENPVETWGRFDLLVLDDPLITAKTAKLAGFLKHLIGYIREHNRRFIITSQVGGDDYIEHIKKGGEASRVDNDTAEALIGRIREECPPGSGQQVSFASATPKDEEQAF